MTFLLVYNGDGAPIHETFEREWRERGMIVERLGRSREAAMLWSQPDETLEARDARHAVSLAGGSRLVGRIRLDRRDELCAQLGADMTEPDALLCLRAYARWGDCCVDRLRGDFCFAVWDEAQGRIFCARDHLGVRPLFYGRAGERWWIGDSLDTVAHSSGLDNELDDTWIADFLLRHYCRDVERTVYAHVKRLAPAHVLAAMGRQAQTRRYWALHIDAPIFYRRSNQYLEHFHEALARATRDRLPAGRIGVAMSGGLDSTTLAAKVVEVAGDARRVVAFTSHFERLMPDEEAHYSALVARRLGISQRFLAMDDAFDLQERTSDVWTHEPGGPAAAAPSRAEIESRMGQEARVWFLGEGPDNALTFEWRPYLRWLAGRRDWCRLVGAILDYLRWKDGRDWALTLAKLAPFQPNAKRPMQPTLPGWISRDLAERVDLGARAPDAVAAPFCEAQLWRPDAMRSFTSPIWQKFLEHLDPAMSGGNLDYRHPYLDLDVLTFMLRAPPIPWARRKRLIREAMRGRLPDEVLARVKTPLAIDPGRKISRNGPRPPLLSATLANYVDVARLPADEAQVSGFDPTTNVWTLDAWLYGRRR